MNDYPTRIHTHHITHTHITHTHITHTHISHMHISHMHTHLCAQVHALLLDSGLNSGATVRLNIFQAFLLAAAKLHWCVVGRRIVWWLFMLP